MQKPSEILADRKIRKDITGIYDQIEADVVITFEHHDETGGPAWTMTYQIPELAAYAPKDCVMLWLPTVKKEGPLSREKYQAIMSIAGTVAFIRQWGAEHYMACVKIGAIDG